MQQDTPPMDMPQDMNNMGGDFMPQGDMGMPQGQMGGMDMPQDDMGMNSQSQFDTNFDAGVEADEEQDPKKFIQQLTGKLSQSLRKYNDDNGQPDVDLNKYVAGMIVKQAMDGLSPEDAEDIIDKVKADEDFEMDDMGQQDMEQMPQDDEQMPQEMNQQQMGGDMNMQQQPMNEKNMRKYNMQIREIVNGVLDDYKKENGSQQKGNEKQKRSFRTKPFGTRDFKKN